MKLNRCPICHSHFDIMAMAQDEATQKLLARLATFDTLTGVSLLGYLSLFCPPKSSLTAAKSLSLITELEGLCNSQRLAVAMDLVVQTMHAKKRNNEVVGQFKNHNYLKKVLNDLPSDAGSSVAVIAPLAASTPVGYTNATKSKTRSAIEALEQLKQ